MTIAYYLNESELPFRIFPIWNNQRIVSPRPKDRFPDPRIRAKPICNTCKPKAASSVIENPVNPCLAIMSYLLVWHQTHLLYSPSLVAKIFKMRSAKLKLSTVLRSFVKKWFFNTLNPQICYSRRVKSSAAASVCHSQASSVPCNWASSNSAARVTPQASWHKKAISTRLVRGLSMGFPQ